MVLASPRSFAATTSKSLPRSRCARKKFRPIRPNPLMPTRTFAISIPPCVRFCPESSPASAGCTQYSAADVGGPEGKLRGRPSPPVAPRSGPSRQTGSESTGGRAQTRRAEYDPCGQQKLRVSPVRFATIGEVDELHEAAVNSRLRGGRAALRGELAQRRRGVALTQLRDLAQPRGLPRQPAVGLELADRSDLAVGGTAGADEVRVVGVRNPVRARPGLRDDRVLVQRERRIPGAGQ